MNTLCHYLQELIIEGGNTGNCFKSYGKTNLKCHLVLSDLLSRGGVGDGLLVRKEGEIALKSSHQAVKIMLRSQEYVHLSSLCCSKWNLGSSRPCLTFEVLCSTYNFLPCSSHKGNMAPKVTKLAQRTRVKTGQTQFLV